MNISPKGLQLLMQWEGCKLIPYKDAAGIMTIGVGHRIKPGEDFSKGITTTEAIDLLDKDVRRFEDSVNGLGATLNQNQFDALVIFAYNIGTGAFVKSSVAAAVKKGDLSSVPAKIEMWNKAGGKVCQGLVRRRDNEVNLWDSKL